MSGPKSGSYTVVSAAELRRRDLLAAISEVRAAEVFYRATLGAVAGQARTFLDLDAPLAPPALRAADDPAAIRRHAAYIRQTATSTQADLHRRIAQARARSVSQGAVGGVAGEDLRRTDDLLADHPLDHPAEPLTAPARTHRVVTPDTVASDLGLISDDVTQPRRDQLYTQAEVVLQAPNPARAEMLSDQLRYDIQRTNSQTESEMADVREALSLLALLPGTGAQHTDIATLSTLLEQVVRREQPLPADMAERVHAAAHAAHAAADRRFATDVMQDVLEELGYDVQVGFGTVVTTDGAAYFQHPDWPGYGVRWRLGTDQSAMSFNVVDLDASDGTSAVRATEVEDAWCSRMPELVGALRSKGVRFALQRSLHSGTVPVPVLDEVPDGLRAPPPARSQPAALTSSDTLERWA